MKKENVEKIKDIIKRIKPIKAEIENIQWDEQSIFDTLPDDVQESEDGKKMEEEIDNICFAFGACEIVEGYLYDALGLPFGHKFDEDKKE